MSNFWLGFCLAICWTSGIQQFIGKERYLKTADLIWTNEPWWVWPLIALFLVLLHYLERRVSSGEVDKYG